jgi:hypothetical protein
MTQLAAAKQSLVIMVTFSDGQQVYYGPLYDDDWFEVFADIASAFIEDAMDIANVEVIVGPVYRVVC